METVWTGTLRKMEAEAVDPVRYRLADGWWQPEGRAPDHDLNRYLGRRLELRFTGDIACTACGRKTKKTFGPGYCFPCSQTRAEADLCIVRPELCHHGEPGNPCREEAFAQSQCFQPHILYVSLTSGVKVGITRQINVPQRWLDQGAVRAIGLARMADRRTVGLIEKRLSEAGFADKTHWTKLLKGDPEPLDLAATADQVLAKLAEWGTPGVLPAAERVDYRFRYPVRQWPEKVKSFDLDKDPVAGGELWGIKGQYLLFDGGVINLRKYTGYRVEVAAS